MYNLIKNLFLSKDIRFFNIFKKQMSCVFETKTTTTSNEKIKKNVVELKENIKRNGLTQTNLIKALILLKKVIKITLDIELYAVQFFGGFLLHNGNIIEMKTGEGKTVTATIPTFLNYLLEKRVHIATVNDYLAQRDYEWMLPVYTLLGMSCSVVKNDTKQVDRKLAYTADVLYATSSELAFDYLKDNMVLNSVHCVQKELNFIIIDEIDSILIDEARTPLIISSIKRNEKTTYLYDVTNNIVLTLLEKHKENVQQPLYVHTKKTNEVLLTELGYTFIEKSVNSLKLISPDDSLYKEDNVYILKYILNALKAHTTLQKNVDYVTKNNKVLIVDENTGRILFDKRWSNGLHQAVESKENVTINHDTQTISTITIQNYVKLYNKICGMTGTAKTETLEFKDIYNLDVCNVPANKTCRLITGKDLIYLTKEEKIKRVLMDTLHCLNKQIPTLIGTISIKNSDKLSTLFTQHNVRHNLLNAHKHKEEATIIATAGEPGSITIATNMAGRGTDIILGGTTQALKKKTSNILTPNNVNFIQKQLQLFSVLLGGLYVIGTERHCARRIDNQLVGRTARQGDPGNFRFYLALDDKLIKIFIKKKTAEMLHNLGIHYGETLSHSVLTNLVRKAQETLEYDNYTYRKNLLDFDNVLCKQRNVLFKIRKKILQTTQKENTKAVYSIENRQKYFKTTLCWEKKILLCIIDVFWKTHLTDIENIKNSMYLQVYSNKNPIDWYKKESYTLFTTMLKNIQLAYKKKIKFIKSSLLP